MVYDLNGNRTGKTGERLGADGKRREMRTAYSYDLMNRLTEERRKDDGDIYSYDSAGNRIRKQHYYYDLVTGENSFRCLNESIISNAVDAARCDIVDGEESYCYNEGNQLTERKALSGITEYLYDENGSLVSEKEGEKTTSYHYDLLNRQIYVRTLNGKEQENLYDGEGLRAGLTENGKVSTFLFYNGEILAESDEDNMPVRRHIQGVGLSRVQTMDNGAHHAYHHDEQGSTAYVTGNSGAVENCYIYDAFGNVLEKKEDIQSRILYTGQQYDQEAGQYYLRARYYSPIMGRFMQEDICRGDGLNLYAYCGNNPVIYYDPSGCNGCPSSEQAKHDEQRGADEGVTELGGAENKNTVPSDTYVFGNTSEPGNARPGKDFGVENGSDVVSAQSLPLPNGKSVCADPNNTNLTGTIYKVPEGTELPEGLGIVYDGIDRVPGGHARGHSTIYPTRDMTVDEFNELYKSMPWEKAGRKKR